MEFPEGGSGSFNSTNEGAEKSPLIPGLPDDVAVCCIARVPRKNHARLKCVSKRWRDLVCSHEWLGYRQKCGLQETWIYALCKDDEHNQLYCYVLDPSAKEKCWRPIRLFDDVLKKRRGGVGFEVIGSKLYVLGGYCWTEDSSDEVYCFDTLTNEQSRLPPLPTARCILASETLNGKIHALGGLTFPYNDARSCDTYDPRTKSWTSVSNPGIFRFIRQSTVMDGKIYIRGGASAASPYHGAVYEPSSNVWENVDSDLPLGLRGPAVVADGNLYVLDEMFGTKLIMWNNESREWVPLGKLSPLLTRPPCRLVAIGRTIYVIGTGLSTVIVDLDNIGNQEGVVVCSSIPFLRSLDIVHSCKCVAI